MNTRRQRLCVDNQTPLNSPFSILPSFLPVFFLVPLHVGYAGKLGKPYHRHTQTHHAVSLLSQEGAIWGPREEENRNVHWSPMLSLTDWALVQAMASASV